MFRKNHNYIQNCFIALIFVVVVLFSGSPFIASAQQTDADSDTQQTGNNTPASSPGGKDKTETGQNSQALTKLAQEQGIVSSTLYNIFTGMGAIALWFAGLLFDYSLSLLVVGMGEFINTGGIKNAIDNLWQVVRDIFNLAFIFSLIFIGFKTILGINESQTRRTLATIIAAALLINFSLFTTKIIVDFSNLAAYQISQAMRVEGSQSIFFGNMHVSGIAGEFVRMTSLDNYSDSAIKSINDMGSGWFGWFRVIAFALLVTIFMLMTAFVFAAGAIMMIGRFVTLVVMMIFSPAMFLGMIFPEFGSYSKRWWSIFLNSAFLAPAYLFMLYLALTILSTINRPGDANVSEAFNFENTGLFGFFLFYALIIAFLWGALKVAQQMGAAGANQALSIGSNLRKNAQSALGAYTVGSAAAGLGWANDYVRSSKFAQSKKGTALRWTANALSWGATSDRSIRSIAQAGKEAKFGGSGSFNSLEKERKERSLEVGRMSSIRELAQTMADETKDHNNDDRTRKTQRAVADATPDQVMKVLKGLGGKKILIANAGNINQKQFDKIMEDESVPDIFKKKLAEERSTATLAKFSNNPNNTNLPLIGTASKAQLKAIGVDTLAQAEYAAHLSSKQMKDLQDELVEADFNVIKKVRNDTIINVVNNNADALDSKVKLTIDDLLKKTPEEISKFPDKVFGENDFTKRLSATALTKIATEKNADVQREIRRVLTGEQPNPAEAERLRKQGITKFFNKTPAGLVFGT